MNPNPAPVAKQRSPVFYVFLGCGLMVLLMIVGGGVVCGGCLVGLNQMGKGIVDPQKREENVKKMLGGSPTGYYPLVTLSVPMVMDMAVLGDAPMVPDAGPPDVKRVIQYWRIISNDNTRQMKDWFDGKDVSADVFRRNSINVDVKDIVGRGVVKTGDGATVKYVATRGQVMNDFQGRGAHAQLSTLLDFECADTSSVRVGVWSERDLHPDKAADEIDPKGTVLDEAQIAPLVAQLRPCGQ